MGGLKNLRSIFNEKNIDQIGLIKKSKGWIRLKSQGNQVISVYLIF